jgi:hypothetical protein
MCITVGFSIGSAASSLWQNYLWRVFHTFAQLIHRQSTLGGQASALEELGRGGDLPEQAYQSLQLFL